jgi:hypothetical protein
MTARPSIRGRIASWRADSLRQLVAPTRNYAMCQNVDGSKIARILFYETVRQPTPLADDTMNRKRGLRSGRAGIAALARFFGTLDRDDCSAKARARMAGDLCGERHSTAPQHADVFTQPRPRAVVEGRQHLLQGRAWNASPDR